MVKNSPTTLYANPKEGSWTLVEKSTDELYCVIATGMGITPIREKNGKEVSR
jgi:ferredoxin-NADP reductase